MGDFLRKNKFFTIKLKFYIYILCKLTNHLLRGKLYGCTITCSRSVLIVNAVPLDPLTY